MLPGFPSTYQKKLLEQEVQDVGKINKIKFQPYVDLVDQAYSQLTRLWLTIKTYITKLKMIKYQLYVGNSHLMKVICNSISKTLLYYCQDPKVFGCTGISAVNIGGSTIHFGLRV